MEYWIRVEADGDDELLSLHQWLVEDGEVARGAAIRLEPLRAEPGQMGGVFDAIIATVGDSVALGSLVVSYLSWRDSRSRPSTVRIERDGLVVDLSGSSPETVGHIIEALTEQPESPSRLCCPIPARRGHS
jgi:hypothetical protein